MVRRLLKSCVACGFRWSGAGLLARRLRGNDGIPWIVAYHRVVEDFRDAARRAIPAMLISRAMLERQIDWIGRHFEIVPLDEIHRPPRPGRRRGPRKPRAAITFDDGYGDVYEHAFPMLRTRGIPAAMFVLSGTIGTPDIPLHDRLHLAVARGSSAWPDPVRRLGEILADLGLEAGPLPSEPAAVPADPHLLMRLLLEALPQADLERALAALESDLGPDASVAAERRPMTWEMLAAMQRAGITIGSHSRTHPLLTREAPGIVDDEIAGSRRDLETRLGVPVRHFAYPNGWFNRSTVRAVAAAGYDCAYTSCRHRDPVHPLLTVPRVLLWENSALGPLRGFSRSVMRGQADGVFDRAGACRLSHHD